MQRGLPLCCSCQHIAIASHAEITIRHKCWGFPQHLWDISDWHVESLEWRPFKMAGGSPWPSDLDEFFGEIRDQDYFSEASRPGLSTLYLTFLCFVLFLSFFFIDAMEFNVESMLFMTRNSLSWLQDVFAIMALEIILIFLEQFTIKQHNTSEWRCYLLL